MTGSRAFRPAAPRHRVLIVDDEERIRLVLARILRARGIDPHSMGGTPPTSTRSSSPAWPSTFTCGTWASASSWGARLPAEPDWQERALAEQRTAIEQHAMRVMAARSLALNPLLTRGADDRGGALIGESGAIPERRSMNDQGSQADRWREILTWPNGL